MSTPAPTSNPTPAPSQAPTNTAPASPVVPPVTPPTPPIKVAPPIVVPFTWNQSVIDAKLDKVKANLSKYEGKPGYNPYIYLVKNVKPLVDAMEGGDNTEATFNKVMSLSETIVPEAPGETAKENREKGCIEPQSSGKSHALGQHVGAGYRN